MIGFSRMIPTPWNIPFRVGTNQSADRVRLVLPMILSFLIPNLETIELRECYQFSYFR